MPSAFAIDSTFSLFISTYRPRWKLHIDYSMKNQMIWSVFYRIKILFQIKKFQQFPHADWKYICTVKDKTD